MCQVSAMFLCGCTCVDYVSAPKGGKDTHWTLKGQKKQNTGGNKNSKTRATENKINQDTRGQYVLIECAAFIYLVTVVLSCIFLCFLVMFYFRLRGKAENEVCSKYWHPQGASKSWAGAACFVKEGKSSNTLDWEEQQSVRLMVQLQISLFKNGANWGREREREKWG